MKYPPRPRRCWPSAAAAAVALVCASGAQAASELTEDEYLTDIRPIQSVSHIAQDPADTPAAVTVLDREFILSSGVRNIADLFRFVPGFQVGYPIGGRPVVSYHGLSGQISQRVQVLIDGRSVYAPYLFGGVDWSSLPVQIDDIDRIEVVRGGNSASYGANAFLGVIQIITRSAAQSVGARAEVIQGNQGIRDRSFRLGRDLGAAQFRVSGLIRADDGVVGRPDTNSTRVLDMRGDVQVGRDDEISLMAGVVSRRLGLGFPERAIDPARQEEAMSSFLALRWRHQINPGNAFSLTASVNRDEGEDAYALPLLDGGAVRIDLAREARQVRLGYHHTADLSSTLRAAWGADWRSENLWAPQLFNSFATQRNQSYQAFGHLEWRPHREWTFNLGGLYAADQLTSGQAAPRVFVHWKPLPGHALKIGLSSAFRTPSLFEQRADWRLQYQGQTLDILYLTRSQLQAERVRAAEMVYLGEWRERGINLDMRLFRERVDRLITGELYQLPNEAVAYDLRNSASAVVTGTEAQLQLRPLPHAFIVLAAHWNQVASANPAITSSVARRGASLIGHYALGADTAVSLSYSARSGIKWLGEATAAPAQAIVGARFTQKIRVAGSRAQLALNWSHPTSKREEFRELQRLPSSWWAQLIVEH